MSIVTTEEIRLIPKRYAIGKRPLSLLLGWGELTYTRLMDGNTPSPQHAEELRQLFDDPASYARILEIGRSRITDMAYTRSKRAVESLLSEQGGAVQATRIFAVADRLCTLAEGDLTPGALQRLVYFAQGSWLGKTGKPLFDELPVAASSGPVYERIATTYDFSEICRVAVEPTVHTVSAATEENGASGGKKRKGKNDSILSSDELKHIDAVYERFADCSGQALARMSRETAPWKKARKRAGVSAGEDCAEVITAKSMTKFFSKNKW